MAWRVHRAPARRPSRPHAGFDILTALNIAERSDARLKFCTFAFVRRSSAELLNSIGFQISTFINLARSDFESHHVHAPRKALARGGRHALHFREAAQTGLPGGSREGYRSVPHPSRTYGNAARSKCTICIVRHLSVICPSLVRQLSPPLSRVRAAAQRRAAAATPAARKVAGPAPDQRRTSAGPAPLRGCSATGSPPRPHACGAEWRCASALEALGALAVGTLSKTASTNVASNSVKSGAEGCGGGLTDSERLVSSAAQHTHAASTHEIKRSEIGRVAGAGAVWGEWRTKRPQRLPVVWPWARQAVCAELLGFYRSSSSIWRVVVHANVPALALLRVPGGGLEPLADLGDALALPGRVVAHRAARRGDVLVTGHA